MHQVDFFRVGCALSSDLQWEGKAALGPILVQDDVLLEELMELSEFPPEPAALVLTHQVTPAGKEPLGGFITSYVGLDNI